MTVHALHPTTVDLTVDGVDLSVSALVRRGAGIPVVFLHGFGSTKEDYADFALIQDGPFVAYDAPGCGRTQCSNLDRISVPFLVATANAILENLDIDLFHLVGHSMGGLTSLMLAHQAPQRVVSFVNIEGNVAPEDCFLSRQIFSHPHRDPSAFLEAFAARAAVAPRYASALFSTALHVKVRAGAVRSIFESMVDLSDNGDLMAKFLELPMPRTFMYGEQNANLTYLPHLERSGVSLAEIPLCGHFPMYSNAPAMWRQILACQARGYEWMGGVH